MRYELHKTTDGNDTILTIAEVLQQLGSITIDKMVGKHVIDISIKKIE